MSRPLSFFAAVIEAKGAEFLVQARLEVFTRRCFNRFSAPFAVFGFRL
jgi:hypothetical protein